MSDVSNEVLVERIEGLTRQSLAESQQVRRDLTAVVEATGRVQDAVTAVVEAQRRHEALDGHRVSMLQITALEKDSHKAKEDIEQLRELVSLKADVSNLKVGYEQLKAKQDSQESFKQGRQSALSTAEKIILLAVATSGPIFAVLGKLGTW